LAVFQKKICLLADQPEEEVSSAGEQLTSNKVDPYTISVRLS